VQQHHEGSSSSGGRHPTARQPARLRAHTRRCGAGRPRALLRRRQRQGPAPKGRGRRAKAALAGRAGEGAGDRGAAVRGPPARRRAHRLLQERQGPHLQYLRERDAAAAPRLPPKQASAFTPQIGRASCQRVQEHASSSPPETAQRAAREAQQAQARRCRGR
jgi:hypothetical protein